MVRPNRHGYRWLGGGSVLRAADVDVGQARERRRQRRLARVAVVLWVTTLAVWWRVLTGGSLNPLDACASGPTPWFGSRRC